MSDPMKWNRSSAPTAEDLALLTEFTNRVTQRVLSNLITASMPEAQRREIIVLVSDAVTEEAGLIMEEWYPGSATAVAK